MNIKQLLEDERRKRDTKYELSIDKPDPLMVAKRYNDEYISLICAMFSYGRVGFIVKFLNSLEFELLNKSDDTIRKSLKNHYYRFQNSEDIIALFIAIKRLKNKFNLNQLFLQEFQKEQDIFKSIQYLITIIYQHTTYRSRGFSFLIGKNNSTTSPYKRWNMFLRWMVRCDSLDMGLWSGIDKKHLLVPLDTHLFDIANKLKLINHKQADQKAVISLTKKLRSFDQNDPIKYDFAIYRLGQEGLI